MARKHQTEEQKAQTEFTELLLQEADEDLGPCEDIANIILRLSTRYKLSGREACIALRDYAQLLVARHMDAVVTETQQRIKELESKLKKAKA
jgi:hypothetical protein